MMVKSKSSKRLNVSKGSSSNGIDRISKLPDHLISRILSLLHTKYAVKTSVLSTRWKFLWTAVTKLYFYFDCGDHGLRLKTVEMREKLQIQKEFTLFVNKVLNLVNAPVQEFCLSLCCYDCIDPSDLISWISFGFGSTVRKFSVFFQFDGDMYLPVSDMCCNVAVLDLFSEINFIIPASASIYFPSLQSLYLEHIRPIISKNSSISFPNLKVMELSYVRFADEDSIQKFLSSSPVLDELVIERSCWDRVECLIVCIPSLTRLRIELREIEHYRVHTIKIDLPSLQYLNLSDHFPCQYLPGESLPFLLQANVQLYLDNESDPNADYGIINILRRLSNVKFLSASGFVLKASRTALTHITLDFHNLTRLEIVKCDCIDLCALINDFLGRMDNLEHIILKGHSTWHYVCANQSCWTEPLNVPQCLLSRVTTVSISDMIIDCCHQFEVLKF